MNNYSQFSYDGVWRNTKIVETTSGSVTSTKQFVWSGWVRSEDRNNSGSIISQFFANGQTISGSSYFFTKDIPGSYREMTDSSGVIQAQYSFDPFGRVTKLQGSLASDFQYAGYFEHQRSGMNLTWFRAYNPLLARWLSRDLIAEAGGVNLYAYVGNNPIGFIDFLGLEEYAIGILSPDPSAISDNGTLHPNVDPGHSISLLTDSQGNTSVLSFGPTQHLGKNEIPAFANGNIDATGTYTSFSGKIKVYSWPISNLQYLQAKELFRLKKKNPGKYTKTNNCTSVPVDIGKAIGIKGIPNGVGPVQVGGNLNLPGGFNGPLPNPAALETQLNQIMTPTTMPTSSLPPP